MGLVSLLVLILAVAVVLSIGIPLISFWYDELDQPDGGFVPEIEHVFYCIQTDMILVLYPSDEKEPFLGNFRGIIYLGEL